MGIVLNDLSNPWFIDLLAGLSATLHSSGLSPLLTDRATDGRIGISSVEKLLAQDVDGLVLVGTMAHDQAAVGLELDIGGFCTVPWRTVAMIAST